MTICAGDQDRANIYVNGSQSADLGDNFANTGTCDPLTDYSYSNTSGRAQTVTLEIEDTNSESCPFFSDDPNNAVATKTEFSISDGGGTCTSGLVPTLGNGNFNGSVSINRTP
jgi:hypothetical protein